MTNQSRMTKTRKRKSKTADVRRLLEAGSKAAEIGAFDWWIQDGRVYVTAELEVLWALEPHTSQGNLDFWRSRAIEEDWLRLEALFEKCKSNRQENCELDFRIVTPGGVQKWLHLKARLHYDQSGRPVHMTGINMDITARKQEEDALRKSQIWFNALADNIPELVYLYEPSKGIIYFNRRTTDYLGVPAESLYGDGYTNAFHPDDRPATLVAIQEAIAGRKVYSRRNRIRVANGDYHWFEGRATPVEIDGITKWFGVTTDIDDKVRLEQELRQKAEDLQRSNAQLAQSNFDLERFATVVAHDLHTPLDAISTVIYALYEECGQRLDPQLREYLGFLENSAERMRALLDAVLRCSRVDQNTTSMSSYVDCAEIVAHVLEDLQPQVRRSGAIITADPLPTVFASAPQVAQVFLNLISNAIRYHRPELPPRVHLSAVEEEHAWALSVEDNGIGIEAEEVPRIFDLFSRARVEDKSHPRIGLAVCRRVIENHGGRIWVETAPGKGSRFTFTLPKAEPARVPARAANSSMNNAEDAEVRGRTACG